MTARLSIVIEYHDGESMPSFGPNTHALGGRVIAFAVGDRLVEPGSVSDDIAKLCAGLSPREKQVVALVAAGKFPKQIAAELGISSKTVNSFRNRIHKHFGVRNDVQVVNVLMAAKVQ